MNNQILDEIQEENSTRRRDLLPTWIKVFVWIFLLFGLIAPIALVFGILGIYFNLSLYGFETMQPLSPTGILIIFLFAFKGVVSFGLWTEKSWAVNLAIADAIIGIILCIVTMIILPIFNTGNGFNLTLRLDLVPLFMYLMAMNRIKSEWVERSN